MARETKNRERKEQKEPKRFTFSLSSAGMISLTVVSVAALAWIFILGVLVGRGYKPEQAVPQLAEIMPRIAEQAQKPEAVLKAEELDFFESLKRKPGASTKTPVPTPTPTKPTAKATPKGQTVPKAAETAAKTTTAVSSKEHPVQQAAIETTATQQFRYVYQVGSLKNPDMATAFAAKLQNRGLKTSVEEARAAGALWHRVLVHYTGTPESTDDIKAILKSVGVDKPIMKSKQPL